MYAISKTIPVRRCFLVALAALALLDLTGCGATRGRRGAPEPSGFLGDYSQLTPREGYEAQEVYIDPSARWSRYRAIHIDSVSFWAGEQTSDLSPEERQMLTDLLYTALQEQLGARFVLTDRAGADVLRIRAALTQARGARVVMRTLSTLVPQALLIGTAVGLAADTANSVGTVTGEMEIVDSVTGDRLAAAVDSRAGTKKIFTGRTFQEWGDVKAACEHWAERMALFLARQGVPQKPGAPPAS